MIEMLWDEPLPSAAANVRSYVAIIRRALKSIDSRLGEALLTVPGNAAGMKASYRLNIQEFIDVHRFRRSCISPSFGATK